jgi:hypothetical protein
MYTLVFNGAGVIQLTIPDSKDADAEIIAERFRFLKSIAGTLARFNEDLIAAANQIEA